MSNIVDHTDSAYKIKWKNSGAQRYNGAYYYSIEIVNNIIPYIKTDRNWVTINIPGKCYDHSIVFIHNNKNPERYAWLRKFKDLILVCGIPSTCDKVRKYGTPIYLPLSVDVEEIKKHIHPKVKEVAFAGRYPKRVDKKFPKGTQFIESLPRDKLLDEISQYRKIYAVGRTAIEAMILGCKILPYDPRYPDTNIWKIRDNKDVIKILQYKIDQIDKGNNMKKVISSSFRSRLTDSDDWFNMWFEDKQNIIDTMIKNMTSDLDAGYDYFGKSMVQEREELENYKKKFDDEMELLKSMTADEANRWCFYDMKKRGAIE